jgi:hypothetical protein
MSCTSRICRGVQAKRKFAYFVALLARFLYRIQWNDFALNVQVGWFVGVPEWIRPVLLFGVVNAFVHGICWWPRD